MIRENQIIFTYLHLAAAKELTQGLINSKSVCIAYETVTDKNGRLPLLAPMSAVAGRMSVQAGAHCLEKNQKGRGILLGGAPGGEPAEVVIPIFRGRKGMRRFFSGANKPSSSSLALSCSKAS